ncbi:MAG: hypothetical protein ABFD50_08270 [Smithella sp.]
MDEKTEVLSYVEALKRYVNTEETGERVVDRNNWKYWVQNGVEQSLSPDGISGCGIFGAIDAPFRIIKPAPKPVTLNDCLRAKRVRVTPPEGVDLTNDCFAKPADGWWSVDAAYIHTAIANGWQVEILEG